MIELDNLAGEHISAVCKKAVEFADEKQDDVKFNFNDIVVVAHPGDTAADLEKKWREDMEAARVAYISSPEYKARKEREERELAEKRAAHMVESAQTEKEMRETDVPWPLTKEQLTEYIESLVNRSHDYGTCVYAMSKAATAAFYYVAGHLGTTGFQSSCADLDILRRTRHMKGPFMIIKAEDALYPQYDLPEKLREAMESWKPWLKEQAVARLQESHEHVHPGVKSHWEEMAKQSVGAHEDEVA